MTILSEIRAYKLAEIASGKSARPLSVLEAEIRAAPPVRPFAKSLREASGTGYGLIAEIKRASPSKGLIRADFDPAALARAYAGGGATCLSVLTDGPSFQGAPEFLVTAREATSLPVLRKDFLYDPWQVYEARAMGADCILIILAAVSDTQASELEAAAEALGMDVLIEVHNREELARAGRLKSQLLGINNRDLNTFVTSLDVTLELAREVPPHRVLVSESGISTPADLAALAGHGVRCFLVGESLMREADVRAATRALIADPARAGAA